MKRLAAVLAVLVLVSGCGAEKKETLPDRTLPAFDATSKAVDLADLKGPVVINLWAQWCGPCREDLPYYEQFHTAHPGVEVLGVNWRESNHARAVQLLSEKGVTYPSVIDKDGTVIKVKTGMPNLLLIDKNGDVAYHGALALKSSDQLEKLVEKYLPGAL